MVALMVGNVFANMYSTIITQFLGQVSSRVEGGTGDTMYFKSDYTSLNQLVADETEYAKQVQGEGAVLLKNDAGLPIASNAGVTLLGRATQKANFLLGGGGSGSISGDTAPDLKTVFEDEGMSVNSAVWDHYAANSGAESTPSASLTGYTDAGIVVISRGGNEGNDLRVTDLQFTQEELDLINYAVDNFDKAVVLLNTMNPMELGPIIDLPVSIVWVGAAGEQGLRAIPAVLDGGYNPSGRLVDTYAADNTSAPAYENFGNFSLQGTDGLARASAYFVFAENIYVGYKYYETRYADVVMGQGNAGDFNYADQIIFPFGYGLSYTTFEYSNMSISDDADSINITVTVTNTGSVAGKEVVEVYMQSPYTDYDRQNLIEKSAVQLGGFEKTGIIEPGQSENVTVSVPKWFMRTYDSTGYKTYIVEAGDYYFSVGDSHQALNNILAAQGYTVDNGMTEAGNNSLAVVYNQAALDTTSYATGANGVAITNQFDKDTYTNYDSSFRYLTRQDWVGTYPTPVGGENATEQFKGVLTVTSAMLADLQDTFPVDNSAQMPTQGADNGLTLVQMRGLAYDDPKWEQLIDQMSAEDMMYMIGVAGYGTPVITSIAKPFVGDKDGPAGISATLIGGVGAFGYATETLLAATWNKDLAEQMGYFMGEDSLLTGVSGWYAPSMNMHRTALSGRNFEYYSEDPMQAGIFAAITVQKAWEKGMYCYIKHFALNDQETNRGSNATFATEQTIRENDLLPFEIAVREGGANGVMVSMNRVGTKWSGAHKGMTTNVLRGEWGFLGVVITDTAASYNGPMNLMSGIDAGTDLWLCTANGAWERFDGISGSYTTNASVLQQLRKASHNALYIMANSNAMNGLGADSVTVEITPPWVYWLYALDAVVIGGGLIAVIILMRGYFKNKKKSA